MRKFGRAIEVIVGDQKISAQERLFTQLQAKIRSLNASSPGPILSSLDDAFENATSFRVEEVQEQVGREAVDRLQELKESVAEAEPAKKITDLRVDFDVTQRLSSGKNEAKVTIYNASQETIKFIEDADSLQVKAGYREPSLVFKGPPANSGVMEDNNSVERKLEIEAKSDSKNGSKRALDQHVSVSLKGEVGFQKAFYAVISEFSDAVDVATADFRIPQEARERVYNLGYAVSGKAKDVLDEIVSDLPITWLIEDETLYVFPKGEFKSESGILAKDQVVAKPNKTDQGVEVKMLLEPKLRPGDKFVLSPEKFDRGGAMRAKKVRHRGSLWGNSFHTTVTGQPIDTFSQTSV